MRPADEQQLERVVYRLVNSRSGRRIVDVQARHQHSSRSASAPVERSNPPPSQRIRLVPHLDSSRSLVFEPIVRDVVEGGAVFRVGRFADGHNESGNSGGAPTTTSPRGRSARSSQLASPNSTRITFRTKVVSRHHAAIWLGRGGTFYVKDTSSSSGTFLNHMRLSPPGTESRPYTLKDGDVIQLGVDYQGGTEEMFRCVKMRVEVGRGREWQSSANTFNTNVLKQLSFLHVTTPADPSAPTIPSSSSTTSHSHSITDCCICLFPLRVLQSLFIAPCSHTFHYKCARRLLTEHYPAFTCPLCRGFANLEDDVDFEYEVKSMSVPDESRELKDDVDKTVHKSRSVKESRDALHRALGLEVVEALQEYPDLEALPSFSDPELDDILSSAFWDLVDLTPDGPNEMRNGESASGITRVRSPGTS